MMDGKHDTDYETELLKRKSKSPSLLSEHENKRPKIDQEDSERSEDIAKQYKKFKAAPKFNSHSEELFCVCRKPDLDGELMISCDGCEEWFHTKCMKIDPDYTQLLDKFYCKFCQWKGNGITRWNKKCRMPGCLKPIRKAQKSKYCSDECGEKFLLSQLSGSQVFTPGDLSFVVNYCGTYADLKSLGSKFPELPEVLSLDLKKLPPTVQKMLIDNEQKQKDITAQYEQSQSKSKYLVRLKEMIAVINDKVQTLAGPGPAESGPSKSKKKKSRSKKIDLCCFQDDLNKDLFKGVDENLLGDTDVRDTFKTEIDDAVNSYTAGSEATERNMCLQDRRKCLRHNGWYNLLSDRVWKRQIELQAVLAKLKLEKSAELRNYSISVYEKQV
ncbi:hypothetical protein JCM33374_g706 [Metschnikowia sp. JCM 33374]|nr:hypothetical protein JCM33374_g706 [Metschnikowia sp. JCM 33374]